MITVEATPRRGGTRHRIVLLDDDVAYAESLAAFLNAQGCEVHTLHDADRLEAEMAEVQPDLLLLDQCLGTTTGTDVLRAIRASSGVPCIVITGVSNPLDRIVNLEIGADDEVDKSASPRELLARIRAVSRRWHKPAVAGPRRWALDVDRRELRRPDGSLCHLTSSEFDLLKALWDARGQPVSRATLMKNVYRRPFTATDRAVDTGVLKLRGKIDLPGASTSIKTVRGIGYAFVGFPDAEIEE